MKNKRKFPKTKTIIKDRFLPILKERPGIIILKETNPLRIKVGSYYYDVYIKCISGGGAKQYSENQTRAQLDSNPSFDVIKKSNDRFLFLGYDIENDVFVCWDPVVIKQRLNKKENVAIWSRKNFQTNALNGEIKKYSIPRNPDLVSFRRCDIYSFIENIEVHFPNMINREPSFFEHDIDCETDSNKTNILDSIDTDVSIKLFVDEKIAKNVSTTMIVNSVAGSFYQKYPHMRYGDWSRLLRPYIEDNR